MKVFAANWKMNLTLAEALSYAKTFIPLSRGSDGEIIIFPPSIMLHALSNEFNGTKVSLGCQNVHYEESGAFTGELSCSMVRDFCPYVLIGHSERRHLFGESDEIVHKKLVAALEHGLRPVLCVGELLESREAGHQDRIVIAQLRSALAGVDKESFRKVMVAYEPVWAIGTGKTATPADAKAMHTTIRKELALLYGDLAGDTKILYGGSVKPANSSELLAQENIDGVLVGGASLNPNSFSQIVHGGQNG